MLQLTGIHHLTAITADAPRNHLFYTQTLGMRLVKKSVNQDDVSAYHLFYADGLATPGTDLTFFDWPAPREQRGTRSIARTGLRIGTDVTLRWWVGHLDRLGARIFPVVERDGRLTLDFEDFEGQRLSLVVDGSQGEDHPWDKSPIPPAHQIRGLGPITLSVPELRPTERILTDVLNFRRVREYSIQSDGSTVAVHVFETGAGGPSAEIHLAVEPHLPPAKSGAGGVHHVALRTPNNAEYEAWENRLRERGLPSSGPVDRYYFRSLYFREPNGILFEIATDGPGFAVDETMENLGERLALPPFLEPRREQIEAGLKPLKAGKV